MTTTVLKGIEMYIKLAAAEIIGGGVVAFPTETVYGLGANAYDEAAVAKIFEAKGRPADNPLIVHICDKSALSEICTDIPELAYKLADRFWPGPFTMVLPKSDKIPYITSGGLDTVGVRMPSHPVARQLISLCETPIAAPSANLSGSPSPTSARRVFEDMNGRIPYIIDGGECEVGLESTVVAFEDGGVRILRPGGVTKEMLEQVAPRVIIDEGVTGRVSDDIRPASPGMKYKHYAPKAEVILVKGSVEGYRKYVEKNVSEGDFCLVFDASDAVMGVPYVEYGHDPRTQAHMLFEALRELDGRGAHRVFARCPDKNGIGLAVYNRILRAAAFNIVEV